MIYQPNKGVCVRNLYVPTMYFVYHSNRFETADLVALFIIMNFGVLGNYNKMLRKAGCVSKCPLSDWKRYCSQNTEICGKGPLDLSAESAPEMAWIPFHCGERFCGPQSISSFVNSLCTALHTFSNNHPNFSFYLHSRPGEAKLSARTNKARTLFSVFRPSRDRVRTF